MESIFFAITLMGVVYTTLLILKVAKQTEVTPGEIKKYDCIYFSSVTIQLGFGVSCLFAAAETKHPLFQLSAILSIIFSISLLFAVIATYGYYRQKINI